MSDNKSKKQEEQKLMRAVVVDKFGGELRVQMVPIPKPKPGQVLIKMEASQINPSDLAFINGKYGIKMDPPFKVGLEGAGTVVANGGGLVGWYLLGKKVIGISTGTTIGAWAEYMVTSSKQIMPLAKGISFDQGAGYVVNPMTVMAFTSIMKKDKHKAAVQTAAASAVGKMFLRMMQLEKREVINVVRKEEQAEILRGMGAKYILNSNEPDFEKKLKALCAELGATCFFDAVGGDLTWQVLKQMPMFSTCYIYGHLSISPTNKVDASHIIFTQKTIKPFYLAFWVRTIGLFDRLAIYNRVNHLMRTGYLSQNVIKGYPLEKAEDAVKFYTANMSLGKVVIKPRM